MNDTTFRNREKAIEQIWTSSDQATLLNFYGEGGIGKTRLLLEARTKIQEAISDALVMYLDLRRTTPEKPETLLQVLVEQGQGLLTALSAGAELVAGEIVSRLTTLSESRPIFLMVDTTEIFQENMAFWRWLEGHLVGPLAVEGKVRQIFAGRVPVPWRRVEVRRIVKLVPLEPLSPDKEARELVSEVLVESNPELDQTALDAAARIVLAYSFGHPALSERLAGYVAPRWPTPDLYTFKRTLCDEVVKPFINQLFFKNITNPWDEILWWASVLDWFDATVLQRYLNLVAPALIEDKADYFFIQGISRLRTHHTIIWREERGDRLHGVVGKIVRQCLKTLEPERYRLACRAAADTLTALADEFPPDYAEYHQYQQEARAYRRQAEQEEINE